MKKGFTIVELLIVIVVIGILAAITIVAFNGVQNKAKVASLQSDLSNAAKKLETYKVSIGDNNQYPADLATAGITSSNNLTYYPSGAAYCLAGTNSGNSYFITNSIKVQQGGCVITDQLVAWWQLDNNTTDSIGGNNGTSSGAVATTGADGQANSAYQFNGTSSYIALPANAALNPTNNFSVSAWVKLDANIGTSTWSDILAGNSADWGVGINVNANGDGSLRFTKVSVDDAPASTTTVTKQVWKHVGVTFSNNTIKYYLDGQPNGTATASANFNAFTTSAKRIGQRNNGGGGGFFRGAIDDIRLYNKVVSDSEMNAIYSGGAQ